MIYHTLHTTGHINVLWFITIFINRYLAAVIEQTVRQLLLGPERSCDPPPAVPIKPISSARQRRKVSSNSKADRSINSDTKETDDIMKSESNVYNCTANDYTDLDQIVTVIRQSLMNHSPIS